MSTNWAAPLAAPAKSGEAWLRRAGAAIERRWDAYCRWRLEQAAIDVLHAMSDRELWDIGLTRSEIATAVKLTPPAEGRREAAGRAPQTTWRGVTRRVR